MDEQDPPGGREDCHDYGTNRREKGFRPANPSAMKKILIVDGHDVVRAGVMSILEPLGAVFGEAGDVSQALRVAREQSWDLVILDLPPAGRNALQLLKQLKRIHPELPVLIFSMYS